MVKRVFILLCLFFCDHTLAQDVSLNAETTGNEFPIASWIDVVVKARTNSKVESLSPSVKDSLGQFEIIKLEKRESNQEWDIRLITIDTGKLFIPPIEFVYKLHDDTTSYKAYTNPIFISISTPKIDASADIKDIKPPKYAPWLFEDFLPYIIGVILLLIIALGYYYYRKKLKQKKDILAEAKVYVSPHQEALYALHALEEKKLWQQGKVKEYYSEITEIIRRFFERRWNIIALEMPTSEMLEQMKGIQEALKLWNELETFFFTADLVKFAKYLPSPAENEEEMQIAYKIVREMKPKMQAEPEKELV